MYTNLRFLCEIIEVHPDRLVVKSLRGERPVVVMKHLLENSETYIRGLKPGLSVLLEFKHAPRPHELYVAKSV